MEAWERERFEKGRIRVKRIRNVEAKITRMRPGKKLRSALAVHLMQMLPGAKPQALAEIAQVCAFPEARFLSGDLQYDFQEVLSRRVNEIDTHKLLPYTLALASAMRSFSGPDAYRAWRRKLLPAIMKLAQSPNIVQRLDEQRAFHARLRGVPHKVGLLADGLEAKQVVLAARADRAAQLLLAVASAKQVDMDTELFDALASPVKVVAEQWLASHSQDGDAPNMADSEDSKGCLFPLTTLADLLSACVACGVHGCSLPQLLADVFVAQYAHDIHDKHFAHSTYSMSDVSNIAHAVALLCDDAEKMLTLLWKAAEPKLKTSEPHLVLMLLNAVVRAGSEKLLTSQPLLNAVDEHLVQRLDYDMSVLGNLGS